MNASENLEGSAPRERHAGIGRVRKRNRDIEDFVVSRAGEERAAHTRKPLKPNPILTRLARNHSHRMAVKKKLWQHTKPSKIPEHIKNPIEATIGWTLITMGFLIAWIFALIGVIILWVGREGYKKKKREYVGVVALDEATRSSGNEEQIAGLLYDELGKDEEYHQSIADPEFKLTGVGVRTRKNLMYVTQIFYG